MLLYKYAPDIDWSSEMSYRKVPSHSIVGRIPHSVGGMIIAKVDCMNVTSTRLINFKVHGLNNAQLTILLNRERRKLLLAKGFHSKHADISEIQHSIHELERILRQREMQDRNYDHPVRRH